MAGEFQKDIKFDEVQVGDLILVELFEGNHFYGDRRGVAKERVEDVWYFEGMYPVYKEASGYRMFRVTELVSESTVPTKELDRLRKLETGLKDRVAMLKQVVEAIQADVAQARVDGYYYGTNGVHDLTEKADRIRAEIWPLEAILAD